MKKLTYSFAIVLALGLLVLGCSQPAPAAPTQAPAKAAEPTKAPAAAPTKAPAAAPTQAPAAPTKAPEASAAKVAFPEKGKTISIVVPLNAGGANDVAARALAPLMEKELGIPVQVVNKPGAGSQVGIADVAASKPDGYTLCYPNWPTVTILYNDPERKATFNRKSFEPIAVHNSDPFTINVKADSPIKTMKDLVDAAKAKPGEVKVSSIGPLSPEHLSILQLQKATGAQFSIVNFDGGAPALTALLGGHIDVALLGQSTANPQVKSGAIRAIAVMDAEESKFMPGVPTTKAQGYEVYASLTRAFIAPAGTPKETVDALSAAIKKAVASDEHKTKMEQMNIPLRYMDAAQFGSYWDNLDKEIGPLVRDAAAAQKK